MRRLGLRLQRKDKSAKENILSRNGVTEFWRILSRPKEDHHVLYSQPNVRDNT
jgi:hypothetical protein